MLVLYAKWLCYSTLQLQLCPLARIFYLTSVFRCSGSRRVWDWLKGGGGVVFYNCLIFSPYLLHWFPCVASPLRSVFIQDEITWPTQLGSFLNYLPGPTFAKLEKKNVVYGKWRKKWLLLPNWCCFAVSASISKRRSASQFSSDSLRGKANLVSCYSFVDSWEESVFPVLLWLIAGICCVNFAYSGLLLVITF